MLGSNPIGSSPLYACALAITQFLGRTRRRKFAKATRDSIKTARVGLLNNDSYGEISRFASAHNFVKLLCRHNYLEDSSYLSIFEHLVIDLDVQPARSLVTLNISKPWFFFHALCAKIAG